jgi:hypothetical protein
MSVSFSGELAYEIHVPNASLYAAYLALREAGEAHGLNPFRGPRGRVDAAGKGLPALEGRHPDRVRPVRDRARPVRERRRLVRQPKLRTISVELV